MPPICKGRRGAVPAVGEPAAGFCLGEPKDRHMLYKDGGGKRHLDCKKEPGMRGMHPGNWNRTAFGRIYLGYFMTIFRF